MDISAVVEAFLLPYSQLVTAVSTAIIAISAVITAVLTWRLIRDNRNLTKVGTEPEVVAYLAGDPFQPLTNFVLANVGRGPAKQVEFELVLEDYHYDRIVLRNELGRKPLNSFSRERKGRCCSVTVDYLGKEKSERRTRYDHFKLWLNGKT